MMRIAHLSDLHITDGVRLEDHRETLGRIVDDALAVGPDLVLITGDLAGRTVPHRTTPRERGVLYPALVRLAQAAPVVVLYGNHDQDPDMDALVNLDGQWPIIVLKAAGERMIQTPAGPCFLYWLAYPTKRWLLAGEDVGGIAASQRAVQEKLAALCELWSMQIGRRRKTSPGVPHVFAGHLQIGGAKTSGGEVLAGQEIELQRPHLEQLGVDYGALGHIHLRQEVAERCWYAGSTWRNDFGETEETKGWTLVDIGEIRRGVPNNTGWRLYEDEGAELPAQVFHMDSHCRRFVTLDYRWGQPEDAEAPRWIRNGWRSLLIGAAVQSEAPTVWNTEANRKAVRRIIDGAEVRVRLVVPQQWVAGCPWEQEIANVREYGAHRIQVERTIEPSLRVRAPAVAAAETLPDKAGAYWDTLATSPSDAERAAALGLLDELLTTEDEAIDEARTHAIAAEAASEEAA